jgi:hypothetical protein
LISLGPEVLELALRISIWTYHVRPDPNAESISNLCNTCGASLNAEGSNCWNLVERETLSALVTYEPLTRSGDSATADRRVMENVNIIFELDLQDSILPPQ